MDHDFRMLANPYRLSKEYRESDTLKSNFSEGLMKVIEKEYEGLYINPCIHKEIRESVHTILMNYVRNKVVSEVVDVAVEQAIQDVLHNEELFF
jgi:hypothetical protein